MKEKKIITRRDFLKGTAGLFLAGALASAGPREAQAQSSAQVIVIRKPEVLDSRDEINAGVLQSMLDEAIQALTNRKETLAAWQSLFSKADTVGIKTNAWRYLSTPKELEDGIKRRLLDIGISEKNLSVDDRGVLDNPVFMNATALVNVRPVRTHHWSGVGTCLKNYIMFVRSPSSYHGDACSDLGRIWTLPVVKGKTRLNILCALTPQFYGRGANYFDRRYVWPYKGLIVGTDPVAVDTVGAELLRLKRMAIFKEERALDVPPFHITTADKKYHLGVSDLSKIQIIRLGWTEGALI
ncbi:MAG: twin-arginine translocation signal domain-containing protein [Deltaproteobacteria bacterium]